MWVKKESWYVGPRLGKLGMATVTCTVLHVASYYTPMMDSVKSNGVVVGPVLLIDKEIYAWKYRTGSFVYLHAEDAVQIKVTYLCIKKNNLT